MSVSRTTESDFISFLNDVNNNKEFENKNHMRVIFENKILKFYLSITYRK